MFDIFSGSTRIMQEQANTIDQQSQLIFDLRTENNMLKGHVAAQSGTIEKLCEDLKEKDAYDKEREEYLSELQMKIVVLETANLDLDAKRRETADYLQRAQEFINERSGDEDTLRIAQQEIGRLQEENKTFANLLKDQFAQFIYTVDTLFARQGK